MNTERTDELMLHDVEVGKSYSIQKIAGKGPLRRRVLDMGLTKGTEFYVRKVAPLGDPVQISVRGYELTLRRADATLISVLPISTQA